MEKGAPALSSSEGGGVYLEFSIGGPGEWVKWKIGIENKIELFYVLVV